jgi:hypothetical protein
VLFLDLVAAAAAAAAEGKPSWTARLLSNPELLCKKVRLQNMPYDQYSMRHLQPL